MPIIESEGETTDVGQRGPFKAKVYFTDNLTEAKVFQISWCSGIGGFLPYLFCGYFSDQEGFNKWYFANARKHGEMQTVVEQHLGKKLDCVWGQINFNPLDQKKGYLRFHTLVLNDKISDMDKAMKLLVESISPACMSTNLLVQVAGEDSYLYVPKVGVEST